MTTRQIALLILALGAFALAVALIAQHGLGLVPCALCYRERWPYRFAIGFGLLGLVLPERGARLACWGGVAALAAALGWALVHVGVEQHWWPSPLPECTAPDLSGLSPAERFARMPDRPVVSCEDPQYLVPGLKVSMAQANAAYALLAGTAVAILLARGRPWRGRTG